MVRPHIALNIIVTLVVGSAVADLVWKLGASFTATPQARQLVTRGLYSRLRSPIYIFGSCVIAGVILAVGRPIWLVVFLVIIPMQIWRGRKEAQVLEAKFGEEYRRYRAGTWF